MIILTPVSSFVVSPHVDDQTGPDHSVECGGGEIEPGQDLVPRGVRGKCSPSRDETAAAWRLEISLILESEPDYMLTYQFPSIATNPIAAARELSLYSTKVQSMVSYSSRDRLNATHTTTLPEAHAGVIGPGTKAPPIVRKMAP
jgi:hypothetical protein